MSDWQVVEEALAQRGNGDMTPENYDAADAALARLREREAQLERDRDAAQRMADHMVELDGPSAWGIARAEKELANAAEARVQELEREKADADATWGQQLAEMQDRVEELEAAPITLVCENCGSGVFSCHNCGAPGSARRALEPREVTSDPS